MPGLDDNMTMRTGLSMQISDGSDSSDSSASNDR